MEFSDELEEDDFYDGSEPWLSDLEVRERGKRSGASTCSPRLNSESYSDSRAVEFRK